MNTAAIATTEPISDRQWILRSWDALNQWVMSQPVKWLVATFSCRLKISKRTSKNVTRRDLEAGFAKTMQLYDYRSLKTSQRKQGIRMMRVPFMGGEARSGARYHIHALIELSQGHDAAEVGSYLSNVFESTMQRMYANDGYVVESNLWHQPYDKYDGRFLNYCGRYEGETLSVGIDKVLLPHLVMKPSL